MKILFSTLSIITNYSDWVSKKKKITQIDSFFNHLTQSNLTYIFIWTKLIYSILGVGP